MRLVNYIGIDKKSESSGGGGGGWAAKSGMAEALEITSCSTGHMTYTQVPAVYEKIHFFTCFLSFSQ